MSYPRTVNLFIPWSKAMVAGATVDKPDYGKKTKTEGSPKSPRRRRRKKRKKRSRRMRDG